MPATTRLVPIDRTSLLPQYSPAWRVLYPNPSAYQHYEQRYLSELFYNRQALSAQNTHCTPWADRQILNDMQLTLLSSQFTPSAEYSTDWSMDLDIGNQNSFGDNTFLQLTDLPNLEDTNKPLGEYDDFHFNQGTLEPNLTLRNPDYPLATCSSPLFDADVVRSNYSHIIPPSDSPPVYQPATYSEPTLYHDPARSPTFSTDTLCSSPCRRQGEQEDLPSKPYARLIYEALMQAQGHRMSLRDIYQWFTDHTTKPQQSRGKGWQNSIRHNLSMNKVSWTQRSGLQAASLTASRHLTMTKAPCLRPVVLQAKPTVCGS